VLSNTYKNYLTFVLIGNAKKRMSKPGFNFRALMKRKADEDKATLSELPTASEPKRVALEPGESTQTPVSKDGVHLVRVTISKMLVPEPNQFASRMKFVRFVANDGKTYEGNGHKLRDHACWFAFSLQMKVSKETSYAYGTTYIKWKIHDITEINPLPLTGRLLKQLLITFLNITSRNNASRIKSDETAQSKEARLLNEYNRNEFAATERLEEMVDFCVTENRVNGLVRPFVTDRNELYQLFDNQDLPPAIDSEKQIITKFDQLLDTPLNGEVLTMCPSISSLFQYFPFFTKTSSADALLMQALGDGYTALYPNYILQEVRNAINGNPFCLFFDAINPTRVPSFATKLRSAVNSVCGFTMSSQEVDMIIGYENYCKQLEWKYPGSSCLPSINCDIRPEVLVDLLHHKILMKVEAQSLTDSAVYTSYIIDGYVYRAQKAVAKTLNELANSPVVPYVMTYHPIMDYLDKYQKEAFMAIATTPINILTGMPGHGKSEALNAIIAYTTLILGKKVMLLAPTGCALDRDRQGILDLVDEKFHDYRLRQDFSERLDIVDQQLETLDGHAMVLRTIQSVDYDLRIQCEKDGKVENIEVLVIDEGSMVGLKDLHHCFDHVKGFERLIIAMDPNQLPAVKDCSVLPDLLPYANTHPIGWKHTVMKEMHRIKDPAAMVIHQNLLDILQKKMPKIVSNSLDAPWIHYPCSKPEDVAQVFDALAALRDESLHQLGRVFSNVTYFNSDRKIINQKILDMQYDGAKTVGDYATLYDRQMLMFKHKYVEEWPDKKKCEVYNNSIVEILRMEVCDWTGSVGAFAREVINTPTNAFKWHRAQIITKKVWYKSRIVMQAPTTKKINRNPVHYLYLLNVEPGDIDSAICSTIHGVQGKENEIVGTYMTNDPNYMKIPIGWKAIYTACSRSKSKVLVFGNMKVFGECITRPDIIEYSLFHQMLTGII
jgi:hypothetical protein